MNRIVIKIAQIVSDVFSPLLLPTYCMAMAMWITPLQALPERNRMIATLGVFVITGIIPFIFIKLLMRLGRVSDNSIADRSERLVPMIVGILCYVASAAYVRYIGGPVWLALFFVGAAAAAVVSLIITRFWKISAHAAAIGGMVGMLAWFGLVGLANVNTMIWLSAVILLSGAVLTSRLILGRHTLAQVAWGFVLGCAAQLITLSFA